MEWYFNRNGEREKVELEKWMWAVLYADGTELHQFDNNGVFHQVGEIDQSRVKMWTLYEVKGAGRIDIAVPEGAKLIHKYKNYVFNAATREERRAKAYCFGYKLGDHYHYNYVMPDNRVVQSVNEEAKLTEFGI